MEASRFELVAVETELDEPDPEIVLRGFGAELATLRARRPSVESLRNDGEAELNVCLHLARMQGAVEVAELDGPAKQERVQIEPVVAALVVAARRDFASTVPSRGELADVARRARFEASHEARIDAPTVAVQTSRSDLERVLDDAFLLVD